MIGLQIPPALSEEFGTVEALWISQATTRRVDALLLSWVKYEKQLRRLFSYLLFQHPKITARNIDFVISTLVSNRELNPHTFMKGIEGLGVGSIKSLLGPAYGDFWTEISRIRRYRNKLIHGQISGLKITSTQLKRDTKTLIAWISALANAAEQHFGYDGLNRNTFRKAKSASRVAVNKYPFETLDEMKAWVKALGGSGR